MDKMLDRYRGCLLGLAIGDALGTTVEFQKPGTFAPVTNMIGGGVFNLLPGQWTDDTSMALCLAESLIETKTFDPVDQLERYWRWYGQGYMSCTGRCFDIGATTQQALLRFHEMGQPYITDDDPTSAGNGSLMRLAPVAMACAQFRHSCMHFCSLSSCTTHGSSIAAGSCSFFGAMLRGALLGDGKEFLLDENFIPYYIRKDFPGDVLKVANGSYKQKNPPEIAANGYVVDTLEAALWAFYHSRFFEEGALMAVNLGNDADTVGAVYGQIAGAYYGESSITHRWTDKVAHADYIRGQADRLYELSNK